MLVKDMFKEHTVFKDIRYNEFFFTIYGDIVYENIVANKTKYGYVCIDCGAEIKRRNGNQCRCSKCQKIYKATYHKELMRRIRQCDPIQSTDIRL